MFRIKENELLGSVVDLVQHWQRNFHVTIKPALVCENRNDTVNYHSLIAAQKVSQMKKMKSVCSLNSGFQIY